MPPEKVVPLHTYFHEKPHPRILQQLIELMLLAKENLQLNFGGLDLSHLEYVLKKACPTFLKGSQTVH